MSHNDDKEEMAGRAVVLDDVELELKLVRCLDGTERREIKDLFIKVFIDLMMIMMMFVTIFFLANWFLLHFKYV